MQPNAVLIRQGRMLAFVATVLMPSLIAVMGLDRGYPLETVGAALSIWCLGTLAWIAYNWHLLKPGRNSL